MVSSTFLMGPFINHVYSYPVLNYHHFWCIIQFRQYLRIMCNHRWHVIGLEMEAKTKIRQLWHRCWDYQMLYRLRSLGDSNGGCLFFMLGIDRCWSHELESLFPHSEMLVSTELLQTPGNYITYPHLSRRSRVDDWPNFPFERWDMWVSSLMFPGG